MKKFSLFALFFFVAGALVLPAYAQDSAKNAASPSLAASPSAALLKQWNEIGRKLIAMAEDFPEDKYDFKAAPSTGTFAVRMIHGAAANYFFTNVALGQKPPSEEDPARAQFKNKAAIVAYVKKSRFGLWPDRALRRSLRPALRLLPRGRSHSTRVTSEEIGKGVPKTFASSTVSDLLP